MIQINEYFNGNVKSLVINGAAGKETVGVMAPGEYEFSTSQKEVILVISGALVVKLPTESTWNVFEKGDSFEVAANQKFQLKIYVDSSYLCQYM
ncbi:MAG: pyrimidine/purine nucleoside phosphorylase [Bacteroidota bacterium]|nr:pyrimidine/purine nucleoside phosphorylase [Bacteroidota bacterium]